MVKTKRIAIIGGGPSALFIYKQLLETITTGFSIDIFESTGHLGAGMPYSEAGANREHITNVSGNEIPRLVTSVGEWLETVSDDRLSVFKLKRSEISEYKVLPRLLLGEYLKAQFDLLITLAKRAGVTTNVRLSTKVIDIKDQPETNVATVYSDGQVPLEFDIIIISTGHHWPKIHEGRIPGYFDSPYPPSKLSVPFNHGVAIRGSSLTAIDAIRTLARQHGEFVEDKDGKISFRTRGNSKTFKIFMYSRNGLLPCIRFHVDDPHLSKGSLLTKEQINQHIAENDGFLSLDFIFEKDFKESFRAKRPAFFESIKNMSLEEFVAEVMAERENVEPFRLFQIEYEEAKESIKEKRSIYWKEMLAVLSFAMNYPAKHFSAEDMLRLQEVLMPLIAVVIAFAPQSSCEELLALHESSTLQLIAVGSENWVEPCAAGGIIYHYTDSSGHRHEDKYETFIDCIGQPHLSLDQFPFKSLVETKTLNPAYLRFRSAAKGKAVMARGKGELVKQDGDRYFLRVAGAAIDDSFRALNPSGKPNPRIYLMAVPFIGGFNPDYSGFDFCEEASRLIVSAMTRDFSSGNPKRL